MEKVLENSGDLKKTINIAEDSAGEARWLEEGLTEAEAKVLGKKPSGWKHIKEKHIDAGQFRDVGIADNAVETKIFESIKNPTNTLPSRSSKGRCYFLKVGEHYVKTVVALNGYIETAHPTSELDCK